VRGFWGNKGRERAAQAVETREELAEQAAPLLAYTRKPECQATLRVCRSNETAMAVRKALADGLAGGDGSFEWRVEYAGAEVGGRVDALLVRMIRAEILTLDDLELLVMASVGHRIEQQGGVCGCPSCRAARADADGGATRPGRAN
jgi:hypothetical protein